MQKKLRKSGIVGFPAKAEALCTPLLLQIFKAREGEPGARLDVGKVGRGQGARITSVSSNKI